MTRYFNTEGLCDPDFHYMVKLDDRLDKIKKYYVDEASESVHCGRICGKQGI